MDMSQYTHIYLDNLGWELPEGSQLIMFMLKNVATKVPGRNNTVRTAMVFMAVLSRLLSTAIAAVYSASFWAITLHIYDAVVSQIYIIALFMRSKTYNCSLTLDPAAHLLNLG